MRTTPLPKQPFDDPVRGHHARRFGMWLFLISLAVLFFSTIVGFIVIRVQLAQKGLWPNDLPPLPWPLGLSTLALLISSVTMHCSLRSAQRSEQTALVRWLMMTTMLGLLFLVLQVWCWLDWRSAIGERWESTDEMRLAIMGFYVLSGLHALHVVGGLIALVVTTLRAIDRRSSPTDSGSGGGGVFFAAMYWHFLDAVWLILFAYLLLSR